MCACGVDWTMIEGYSCTPFGSREVTAGTEYRCPVSALFQIRLISTMVSEVLLSNLTIVHR